MKETAQQNQKPKGLSKSLKYLFGVGDAGFNLMSNIETFYFMTFLTDLAGFGTAIAFPYFLGYNNSKCRAPGRDLSWKKA